MKIVAILIALVALCKCSGIDAGQDLLLEYLPSPVIGNDIPIPRFSWTLSAADKGQAQSAYQIQVSRSSSVSSGEIWDSGKVTSSESNLITYAGSALQSDVSYYWKVRWWDKNGNAAPWSQVAQFDMGLLNANAWQGASWISGANQLRQEFTISGQTSRARAYISGAGYYELHINGEKVGDYVLDIAWTNYVGRVMYTAYDVTKYLKPGANAVGVMLGRGWYGQGLGATPQLIFLLSIDQMGSSNKVYIASNTTWTVANGPITMDSVYNGENYDATMETPGWDQANFKGNWKAATKTNGPGGQLRSTMFPPIKILESFPAKKITQPKPGVYVVDFGQNFSGWTKLKVSGPKGTTVQIRHGEVLQHDGSGMIYYDNLRSAKATDRYTLKGSPAGEEYQPRFTYHGFRFAELTGFPGTPTLDTLTGYHVHTSVDKIGDIKLNNAVLDQIQHNTIYGQQSNLMSVPTDCDQRDERRGWMGDAQLSAEEAFYNFDMGSFYTQFVRDINDDEGGDGSVTDTVPYMDNYGARPADPAWGAAYPMITFWLNQYKGDQRIMTEQYDGIKRWMDYMIRQYQSTGIGRFFYHYGDWVPPPPAPKCNESFTSAFYLLLNTQQLSQMASKIGKSDDATHYASIYQSLIPEFNKAFYNNGNYANGVQTCNVLALSLGVVTEKDAVLKSLLNDISAHQNHLTTGIIGTKYLPLVLSENGRTDVALTLATQTTYPSWGYMFNQKQETEATTHWELWDSPSEGPGMNSRNHIMFGSVSHWFYRYLAGLGQSEKSVGFSEPLVQPPPANVLLHSPLYKVSASYRTPYGVLSSEWERVGGSQCRQAFGRTEEINVACGAQGGHIRSVSLSSSCTDDALQMPSSVSADLTALCVGKSECTISNVPALLKMSTLDNLYIVAECSVQPSYTLNVQIPVNTEARVHVSKLNLVQPQITESGNLVWQNGKFLGGKGLTSSEENNGDVIFSLGSGAYNFEVMGVPGQLISATASESSVLSLECPAHLTMSVVKHAIYEYTNSLCVTSEHCSKSSKAIGSAFEVVEGECLGKNSCFIPVLDAKFGATLSPGETATLKTQVHCS